MKKLRTKSYAVALGFLALLGLATWLSGCNLPQQISLETPQSPTALVASETLPPPGVTEIIETSSLPAVTEVLPSASETGIPASDTPVPPTPTLAPATVTVTLAPASPTPTTASIDLTITRIQMIDKENGFGEGFTAGNPTNLYRTADGGKSWSLINPPGGYNDGGEFFALDARSLWAAPGLSPAPGGSGLESGNTYHSTDGGQTWATSQPISLATGEVTLVESFYVNSMFFLNPDLGWMVISVGHYMNQDVVVILNTTDGGQTWTRKTDKYLAHEIGGEAMPCQVLGIAFENATHGFMAGNCLAVGRDEDWRVLESDDAGRTWNSMTLSPPANAPAPALSDEAMCAPNGLRFHLPETFILDYTCQLYDMEAENPFYYFTYVSTDGGATWAGAEVTWAAFYSANGGVALGPKAPNGDRYFYTTTDGGRNWVKGYKVTWQNAQLSYVDSKSGWAVAWRYNETSGKNDYALINTTNTDGPWMMIEPKVK